MVFSFLAVERIGNVAAVMLRQGNYRSDRQGNTLVGGTEEHVERNARLYERFSIKAPKLRDMFSAVEPTGIKKVWAGSPGFEHELAKSQDLRSDGKINELTLVCFQFHGTNSWQNAWLMTNCIIASAPTYEERLRFCQVKDQLSSRKEAVIITTVNVNGLRSAVKKGFYSWIARTQPDVLCLQETRCRTTHRSGLSALPNYHAYFHDPVKPGYSGVALLARREPDQVVEGLGWADFDAEGRFLRVDFGNLSIVSLYLPSGSSSEARQFVKYDFMARFFDVLHEFQRSERAFVICGDWNIAHRSIDLKNWRANQKCSGFLPDERAWMDRIFGELGYVDAFRTVNHEPNQYTWWSNRGQAWAKNVGWRIDYQIVTPELRPKIQKASIYKDERFADHAPLTIEYDFNDSLLIKG